MNPHAFENSGGKPRVKQPGEQIGFATPGLAIPNITLDPAAFAAPIYYQGQRPACGGHAGAWYSARTLDIQTPGVTPRFTWIDIKQNGSDTNPSDGTTMPDIFRSLLNTGVDSFEPLENDVTLTDEQYASPIFVSQGMKTNAAGRKLTGTPQYLDNPSFDDLKSLICEHARVILLVDIGDAWWTDTQGTTSWAPADVLPLRVSPKVSGHFIVAHGYTEQWVFFANSWSKSWGIGGHGYFGPDYMSQVQEVGWLA